MAAPSFNGRHVVLQSNKSNSKDKTVESLSVQTKNHRASGRVTLSDVAQAADVSPSTVSRALRGERAVAPALIERVRAVADMLGYVPDPAARALASQRSNHVGVLIPLLSNALFVDLLEAAQTSFRAAGFQTLMGVTHYNPKEEEQLLREQLVHRPAGLLVTGLDHNPATRLLIKHSQVPCVHLMDLPKSDEPALYCVGFKQTDAGAAMTRHLLGRGRRRIAFAAAQLDARVMQRLFGWRCAMKEANVFDSGLEFLNPAPSSLALGGEMFQHILKQDPAVDAIFFCNDDLAQGALMMALRLGVDIPAQVAIAGFNDLTGSDQMLPPLTTVRTPRADMGQAAAAMLLGLIRGNEPTVMQLDLGFEIVQRQSS